MPLLNFILATCPPNHPLPFFPRYSRTLSFVRGRRTKTSGKHGVGFHRDAMMNAAMSASRRETAWFVARASRICRIHYYAQELPESSGLRDFASTLPRSPRCSRARMLDLFALHFARFSSRKSASACRTTRFTGFLSTWRRKFACASSRKRSNVVGKFGEKSIALSFFEMRTHFAIEASVNAYSARDERYQIICPVEGVMLKEQKETIIQENFPVNTAIASSSFSAHVARKSSHYSFPSTAR